jgi:hypothetical protein
MNGQSQGLSVTLYSCFVTSCSLFFDVEISLAVIGDWQIGQQSSTKDPTENSAAGTSVSPGMISMKSESFTVEASPAGPLADVFITPFGPMNGCCFAGW